MVGLEKRKDKIYYPEGVKIEEGLGLNLAHVVYGILKEIRNSVLDLGKLGLPEEKSQVFRSTVMDLFFKKFQILRDILIAHGFLIQCDCGSLSTSNDPEVLAKRCKKCSGVGCYTNTNLEIIKKK